MSVVMESAWDFATPTVIVNDTEEDDNGCDNVVASPPVNFWQPTVRNQRWLVAIISLLFLYWIWADDRKEAAPADAAAVAPAAGAQPTGDAVVV